MTSPLLTLPDSDLRSRSTIHAALGEPVRLAIVESLLLSDLTPQDIVTSMKIRSNLLAHHLNVLEDAGLIERIRSEGDGRRRYLRLCERAGAITLRVKPLTAERVLFLSSDGSTLSTTAKSMFEQRSTIPADAAGFSWASTDDSPEEPDRVTANGGGESNGHLDVPTLSMLDAAPDLVITLCDVVRERKDLPTMPGASLLHWSLRSASSVEDGSRVPDGLANRLDALALALSQAA